MQVQAAVWHHERKFVSFLALGLGLLLAGCAGSTKYASNGGSKGFSPSEYGVSASQRVVAMGEAVPKGGGVYRVGKPYQVRGKWYYPKEDPNYSEVGVASWYGDDFHGRRTSNGEIYNMYALSAAHTTLPVPSYARVTNLKNGRSVIVRVNDRGPFHDNRIIDLSKRTAMLLGMHSAGLGKVKVDYVGRAPLHGHDENYLISSARENGRALNRQEVAMLAPTPEWVKQREGEPSTVRAALSDILPQQQKTELRGAYDVASLEPVKPPTLNDKVETGTLEPISTPVSSLAPTTLDQQTAEPKKQIDSLSAAPLALVPVVQNAAYQPTNYTTLAKPAVLSASTGNIGQQVVQLGTFRDPMQVARTKDALQKFGTVSIEPTKVNGITFYQMKMGPFKDQALAQIALREAQHQGVVGAKLAPL